MNVGRMLSTVAGISLFLLASAFAAIRAADPGRFVMPDGCIRGDSPRKSLEFYWGQSPSSEGISGEKVEFAAKSKILMWATGSSAAGAAAGRTPR